MEKSRFRESHVHGIEHYEDVGKVPIPSKDLCNCRWEKTMHRYSLYHRWPRSHHHLGYLCDHLLQPT
jgi:hypothetical protein